MSLKNLKVSIAKNGVSVINAIALIPRGFFTAYIACLNNYDVILFLQRNKKLSPPNYKVCFKIILGIFPLQTVIILG